MEQYLIQRILLRNKENLFINMFVGNYVGLHGHIQITPKSISNSVHKLPCYFVSGLLNENRITIIVQKVFSFENDVFHISEQKKYSGHPKELYKELEKDVISALNSAFFSTFKKHLFKQKY